MRDRTIHEYDSVVVLEDVPDSPVIAGDSGVVVLEHKNGAAFEVEFPNPHGNPRYLVLTIEAPQLLKLQPKVHPPVQAG